MNSNLTTIQTNKIGHKDFKRRTQEQIDLEHDLTTGARGKTIINEIDTLIFIVKGNEYSEAGFTDSFNKFMPFVLSEDSDLKTLMTNDNYLIEILNLHDVYKIILEKYFISNCKSGILNEMAQEIKTTLSILYKAIMKNKGNSLSRGFRKVSLTDFHKEINKLEF